jgi:hypothetical protein
VSPAEVAEVVVADLADEVVTRLRCTYEAEAGGDWAVGRPPTPHSPLKSEEPDSSEQVAERGTRRPFGT